MDTKWRLNYNREKSLRKMSFVVLTKSSNLTEALVRITGGSARHQRQRVEKLEHLLKRFPTVELHKCSLEGGTKCRYCLAERGDNCKCLGRAFTVDTTHRYQLWAVIPMDWEYSWIK